MIRFELHRDLDVTGASGPGIVADGIRLPDGRAVVRWRGARSSTVLWSNYDDAVAIHGHGGHTRFVDTHTVAEVEWPGITEAVDALELAGRLVFAGPCLTDGPDSAVCVEPAGHEEWRVSGMHRTADGGEWFPA